MLVLAGVAFLSKLAVAILLPPGEGGGGIAHDQLIMTYCDQVS